MTAARHLTTYLALVLLLATGCGPGQRADDDPDENHEGLPEYVALGDSYTAAPLVPEPVPAEGCNRSTGNYPTLVAAGIEGGVRLEDRSCSGAPISALTAEQRPGIEPQLEALDAETAYVTVRIGAADQKLFPILVEGCPALREQDPTGAPCREEMRADGSDELFARAAATRSELVEALGRIREHAPSATVVFVGYPVVFPDRGTCPEKLPLADGDVAYAAEVMRRLDTAARAAAREAGVAFVDVRAVSRGHDICSDDPWIQGVETDPEAALAYHPRAAEQQAVAELVLDALS